MKHDELIADYIAAHTTPESAPLSQINRRTHVYTINPRMLSGHIQGRVLSMLSRMIQPSRILELGTFAGYSALCLAEGLQPDGEVVTIEKNDELEDFIRENLALSPLGNQVHLLIGTSADILPTLYDMPSGTTRPFDLVFMDADKREYIHDYDLLFPLVSIGGWILADNTLWDGHIVEPEYDHDKQTVALREFNDHVATDPRVEQVILPIRDGLTIIRKISD